MTIDKRCMCGGVGVHTHGEWHPKAPEIPVPEVETCECGNELRGLGSVKVCTNCYHHQPTCICKGGLNDQSDHPSWLNACKCGREKYKNAEGDWICPSCILKADECPCEVLEVRAMREHQNYCHHICPKPRHLKKVSICRKLWHGDDGTHHECGMGHQWGEGQGATAIDIAQDIGRCEALSTHGQRCECAMQHAGLHRTNSGVQWAIIDRTTPIAISQDQPQPHDEPVSVTSNVRELVRYNEISNRNNYEATRDFIQSLENLIRDQEAEIRRLSDEQIKPLANYLMQQSDKIGHPGDEGACAMAIRVIGELMGGEIVLDKST